MRTKPGIHPPVDSTPKVIGDRYLLKGYRPNGVPVWRDLRYPLIAEAIRRARSVAQRGDYAERLS